MKNKISKEATINPNADSNESVVDSDIKMPKKEKKIKKEKKLKAIVKKDFSCSRGGHRTVFMRMKTGMEITDQAFIKELIGGKAPLEIIEV